jgi:hypothetical protein
MPFSRTPVSTINLSGAEIVAYYPKGRYAIVSYGGDTLEVIRYQRGFKNPQIAGSIALPGNSQSVDINKNGLIAAAISINDNNDGKVAFYQIKGNRVISRGSVDVGNLPDSIDFSADGNILVTADEGEPNRFYGTEDGVDPEGSISIIAINRKQPGNSKATTLKFNQYSTEQLRSTGLRISGVNPTPGRDLEPEFASIDSDTNTAYVSLQENNGIAVVDLAKKQIKKFFSLGFKNWSNGSVDTSDQDEIYAPGPRNFMGLRMADGITTVRIKGNTYVLTANEGDGRVRPDEVNFEAEGVDGTVYSYGTNEEPGFISQIEDELSGENIYIYSEADIGSAGNFEADQGDEFFITLKYGPSSDDDYYSDEVRAGKLSEGDDFLINDANEGRLKTIKDQNDSITGIKGFGGRSFSIFTEDGELVFDSGDALDRNAAAAGYYDDSRSDDKSVEPEGIVVGRVGKKVIAFVALERTYDQSNPDEIGSMIQVYDITDPGNATYAGYLTSENSLSPEGLAWVQGKRKGGTLLAANEETGTLDAFRITANMF